MRQLQNIFQGLTLQADSIFSILLPLQKLSTDGIPKFKAVNRVLVSLL